MKSAPSHAWSTGSNRNTTPRAPASASPPALTSGGVRNFQLLETDGLNSCRFAFISASHSFRGFRGTAPRAALAQSVEHIIRNDGVTCSSHVSGTNFFSVLKIIPRSNAPPGDPHV
ncbi:hypothetical protein EMEDMD4_10151 [Sinorhizobium medicae]|uniref:Uncharacterized protein n=1 Tax=Sinorhizobium medicae TaxID=110321 RepID=A0A508WN27_9HYPH|nr:hypothetical protein EMEDMD4_10151 [Sinorhizobium medicae]